MKKINAKENLKKLLIGLMIIITTSFVMPIKSFAIDDIIGNFINLLLSIPDGILWVIDGAVYGNRQFIYEEVALGGESVFDADGEIYNFRTTPYKIFTSGKYEEVNGMYYTEIGIFDINFFSDKKVLQFDNKDENAVASNVIGPVIGYIYKSLRNLALILMLLVLLYIGIKILISSIAEQQAKYKQFLVDWLVGFALLFLMHYIMSAVVSFNSILVNILTNDEGDSYYVGVADLKDDGQGKDATWTDIVEGTNKKYFCTLTEGKSLWDNNKEAYGDVAGTAITGIFYGLAPSGAMMINSWAVGATQEVVLLDKYTDFKMNRLLVYGSDSETDGYQVENGYIDLNNTSNISFINNRQNDLSNWGDNGKVYVSASLYEPSGEEYKNKAIIKLNCMSYMRTIASFALTEPDDEGNGYVHFYENGEEVKASFLSVGMGYAIVYLCMCIETVMFSVIYLKRLLQMAFYTMIAPIVAIMYPLDKLGDGKAQAFNTWLKDYIFNVMIQPMHLLIYTIFISAAVQLFSKNILYALVAYGFMIPAEKYFKKMLGFEKASNGGGGPLGGALGRGLAMEGLGKLAGIGPAARKGGSKSDNQSARRKVGKNKLGGVSPLSGGSESGGGSESRGGSIGGISPQSGGRVVGKNQTSSKDNPKAGRGAKMGWLDAARRAGNRKIARATTGGRYDSLSVPGAKKAALAHGFRKGARGLTRGIGMASLGAAGLMTGAATAMATGETSNIWKGTVTGFAAGNKISSNTFDMVSDGLQDFKEDVKSVRAANDEKYNEKYQKELVFEALNGDIADIKDKKQRKEAIDTISEFAPIIDIDSMKNVNKLQKMKEHGSGTLNISDDDLRDDVAEAYKLQSKYSDVVEKEASIRDELGRKYPNDRVKVNKIFELMKIAQDNS